MLIVRALATAAPDPELAWLSDAPLAHSEAHTTAQPPTENSTLGNLVQSALQRARNHPHTLPPEAASHADPHSDTTRARRTKRHHQHRSTGSLDPYHDEQMWGEASANTHPAAWNDHAVPARQLLTAPGFMTQQRAALPPDPLHQLRQLLLRDPLLPIKVPPQTRATNKALACPTLAPTCVADGALVGHEKSAPKRHSQPTQPSGRQSERSTSTNAQADSHVALLPTEECDALPIDSVVTICAWRVCSHRPTLCRAGSGKWVADPRGDDSPSPSKALPQLGADVAGGSTPAKAYSSPFEAALHGYRGDPDGKQQ